MGNINIIEGQNAVQKRYEPLKLFLCYFLSEKEAIRIFMKRLNDRDPHVVK